MFDLETARAILGLVYPIIGIAGVAWAFTRWGTKNIKSGMDSRAELVANPIAEQLTALTATVVAGFKKNDEAQNATNEHLTKLNSKVATQEARSAMMNQRQAYMEGRLGIPIGPMPDGPQDHLAGLAYLEGKKELAPGELRAV